MGALKPLPTTENYELGTKNYELSFADNYRLPAHTISMDRKNSSPREQYISSAGP